MRAKLFQACARDLSARDHCLHCAAFIKRAFKLIKATRKSTPSVSMSQLPQEIPSAIAEEENQLNESLGDLSLVSVSQENEETSSTEEIQPRSSTPLQVDGQHLSQDNANEAPRQERAQSQASRASQDQRSSQSSPASFKTIPELTNAFTRTGWDKHGNCKNKCRACSSVISSNKTAKLMKHVERCKSFDKDLKDRLVRRSAELQILTLDDTETTRLNLMMTEMLIENNDSLRRVEKPKTKAFFNALNPAFKMAIRRDISERYIPHLGYEAHKSFIKALKSKRSYYLSIEFDHWTDLNQRSFLAILATLVDGKRYLVALVDVSVTGHSAKTTVSALEDALQELSPKHINAIMSDSAASCKAAREDFVASKIDSSRRTRSGQSKEYHHVIQHRCLAHFLNLIGRKYCEMIPDSLDKANRLASLFGTNAYLVGALREDKVRKIRKATAVRWYTTFNMFVDLKRNRSKYIELANSDHFKRQAKCRDTLKFLDDELFWVDVDQAIRVLEPFAKCIAVAERAATSSGEAMGSIFALAREIFTGKADRAKVRAANAFLAYFNLSKFDEQEFGLLLAAYALDRRHKLDYLTHDGRELVLRSLIRLAKRSEISRLAISSVLIDEFEQFSRQENVFGDIATTGETALQWWSGRPDGPLKTVAIRLASMRASSANIERVFSVIKLIQGQVKTRYDAETLVHIVRAKLAQEEDPDEELHDIIHQDAEVNVSNSSEPSRSSDSDDDPITGPITESDIDGDLLEYFQTFNKYLNFSIVNAMTSNKDSSDSHNSDEEEEQLVKRYRASLDK